LSLHSLGLSDQESRAYDALARVTSASVEELAREVGVGDTEAADLLEQLARRLLVVRRPAARWAAVRPAVALGALLAQRREDLGATRVVLDELDDAFRAARPDVATDVVLDVAHGPDEIADRMNQIQVTARSEVLSLVKAPVIASGSTDDGAEDDAVRRGVEYRVVLERSMLEEEPRLVEGIHRARAAGEQVRVAGHVPTKLFVVDREVALVPLGSDSAVLLGAGGLVDALVALFEAVWERGQDVDLGPEEPESDDGPLITMLLAGLTDEAIARDLGISPRTLQRRVRGLLDLAGVDTRLQLGYVVAQRGWTGGSLGPRTE
jgi:sugar-specific transcriptional regulator TrmB